MKKRNSIKNGIAIGLLIVMQSCYTGKSVYTNATMGSTAGYIAKPIYNGENRSDIYVTGEFGNGNVSNNNGNEDSGTRVAALNVHRAHARKNFNFYYGVGAELGSFKFWEEDFQLQGQEELISAGKKNFYSLQAKTGINYLVSRPYADFRILGLDLGFISEFGPYIDTLKELESNVVDYDAVEVYIKESTFYLGLNSEIVFKLNENNSIGINPFLAKSFLETKNGLSPNLYGLALSYRYSDFTLSFFNEVNSQYSVDTYNCKIGLSYRL